MEGGWIRRDEREREAAARARGELATRTEASTHSPLSRPNH